MLLNLRFRVGEVGAVQIRALLQTGLSKTAVARLCKCSRWAIYRAIRDSKKSGAKSTKKKNAKSAAIALRQQLVRRYITMISSVRGEKTQFQRGRPSKKPGWTRPSFTVYRSTKQLCYPSPASVRRVLASDHAIVVSRTTIRRDIAALQLKAFVRPVGPKHDRADAVKREAFCRWILRQPRKYLRRIIFSDEKYFDTNFHGNKFQYARSRKGLLTREKSQGGASVFCWIAIGHGVRILVFVTYAGKGMEASEYLEQCIRPNKRKLRNKVLQADGARVHWTDAVREELEELSIETLGKQWPAYSPDLNCVENLWAILSARVAERAPFGEDELRRYIREEFDRIPDSTLTNLVDSMAKRAEECVKNKGGLTRH